MQRKGQEFSSSVLFLICRSNFYFVAFIDAEWLTPDEREPPACSSPVVENLAIFLGKGALLFVASIY